MQHPSSVNNAEQLFELVAAIEDNQGIVSPLIAVCDDLVLRERLIAECEQKLAAGITVAQVWLEREEPSLRSAVARQVQDAEELGVCMVLGAEVLRSVSVSGEQTEIDKFMGYLQWGREGLRAFKFPIVLWLTEHVHLQMINLTDAARALDFWSWRRGDFRFKSEALGKADEQWSGLTLVKLENLVTEQERKSVRDLSLGQLYCELGKRYWRRFNRGRANKFHQEYSTARYYFRKAVELQSELGLEADLAETIRYRGLLLLDAKEYQDAIISLHWSLTLHQKVRNYRGEAQVLSDLGDAHYSLTEYREAISFHERSINLNIKIGNYQNEAKSLNKLGLTYHKFRKHKNALVLNERSLKVQREIGDREGKSRSLCNMAEVYKVLQRYELSWTLLRIALMLKREIGDREGEGKILSKLSFVHRKLRNYEIARDCCQRALLILQEVGDESFIAYTFSNLGYALTGLKQPKQALQAYREAYVLYEKMGVKDKAQDCREIIYQINYQLSNPFHRWTQRQQRRWQQQKHPLQKLWRWLQKLLSR